MKQIDYLAENGFGMVEISPFNAGLRCPNQWKFFSKETIYPDERLKDYDNLSTMKKLETVIVQQPEKGITVDLNMGSGYVASYKTITPEHSHGNMALGRNTVTVADDGVNQALTLQFQR